MDTKNLNLIDLFNKFGSDAACREYLEHLRWPDGVRCPRCDNVSISRIAARDQYDCNACRYQFSVTSGTVLHDTHLPLSKWFATAYMMIEGKKGISALEVKRSLGVAYKTAWYLCHRIRTAMKDAYPMPLKGRVEIDETWHGGKAHGKGHGYTRNKAIIVGAYQRGGKIILKVVKSRKAADLKAFIAQHVHDDAEAIYTDDWSAYRGIGDGNTRHETVNHSEREYVRGDVSTNGIENVWGLFKRAVVGTFHHMSVKHLDAYLDELEWRFNNRENPYLFRDTIKKLIDSERIEFSKLTA
jgi:transposase-like protein